MKFRNTLLVAMALVVALTTHAVAATITPSSLTCEYESSPVLDIQNPRLSWVNLNPSKAQGVAQTAYRIRVSTTPDFSTTVWDTGKVTSAESAFITYKGKPLASRTTYWWQVMVWDESGSASAWSTPASWHMGLGEDEWQGEWIGAPWQGEESYDVMGSKEVLPAPLLRKEFSVKKPIKQAHFYGTGLGYFELYINGERVGEDYLSPNQTNYTTRPTLDTRPIVVTDPFEEYTVMYLTHDITSLLRQGDNAIGAILGNGFYDVVQYWPALGYGTPRFMGQVEIEYADGSREVIASDSSWRAERSAIVSDQIYLGEHYDARLEHDGWATASYDDSSWAAVAKKNAPIGKLIPQNGPADRITKRYAPIEFEKRADGVIRIKFEEEISGWLALKNIKAERGQRINIKYITESPGQGTNSYTAKGVGEESYHARFTWFVFSEVEVTGIDNLTAEQVEAHAVNSDVETSGEFRTSNNLINKINKIWQRSQLDNMHGAIASDCPHRERSPYTGDGQVACVTVMHNFNAQTFYNKWLRDIRGSQLYGGYVPNSAPWQPGCGGGVGWGAAMEIMPWEFYQHYGDRRVLEQNFNAMRRHVRWMTTWVDGKTGLMLSHDEQQWKNLGDWLPPRELPKAELVHTYFLWQCADIVVRTAHSLGEDASEFIAIRDAAAKAFHDNLYDPATGSYGKFGSNVLALKIGVPEERKAKVVEALRQNIAEVNDHLDTGIVATRFLFEVLCDNGLKDLAYKIINQRDFPSFGWWIEQGATVTWENWDGRDSRNHPMFGGGIGWFYRDLAGLRVKDAGFRSFDVRPVVPEGLEWVDYTHNTTYGEIAIRWEHRDGRFKLICDVPVGSTATLWLPFSGAVPAIKESANIIRKGVREGYALYKIRAGHYEFETAY